MVPRQKQKIFDDNKKGFISEINFFFFVCSHF